MIKKISFFLMTAIFLCVYGMEESEITFDKYLSNLEDVSKKYNVTLPSYESYNKDNNPYGYWDNKVRYLKVFEEQNVELLKQAIFIKIVKDFFPQYDKIHFFNTDLNNWIKFTNINEKNMFATQVCQGTLFYYFVIDENNKIEFFYDELAPWYMNIQDTAARKTYVDQQKEFLQMTLTVTALRNCFMHPNNFLKDVVNPVLGENIKEKLNNKEKFLARFIKKFLKDYPINKKDKSAFIYAYCFFFNFIFKQLVPISEKVALNDLINLFKDQKSDTLQYIENNYLYDSRDIISIILDDNTFKDNKQKKEDFFNAIRSFERNEQSDLTDIIRIISDDDSCSNALVKFVYEENLEDINKFLSYITDVYELRNMCKKIIENLDIDYFDKYDVFDGKIITKEKKSSFNVQKGKKLFEYFLNMEFKNDVNAQNFYKKALLYEKNNAIKSNYSNNLNYVIDHLRHSKNYDENQLLFIFSYFMDAAAKNSKESAADLADISYSLNNYFKSDLSSKKILANILCAQKDFTYSIDDKNEITIEPINSAQSILEKILQKEQHFLIKELLDNDGTYNLTQMQIYIKKIMPSNDVIYNMADDLKNYFKQFVSQLAEQLQKEDNITIYELLIINIASSNFIDFRAREKLENYFCNKNPQKFAMFNIKDEFVFSESPFSKIYMNIKLITERSTIALRDNDFKFQNHYQGIFEYMTNPDDFIKDILNHFSDKQKIDFLNIYIHYFNIRHKKEFIFGYVNFFNTVINSLENVDINTKIEITKNISDDYLIDDNKTKIMLKDNKDFLSMYLNNEKDDTICQAFISAIKHEQDKQRMRDAFNASTSLQIYIMRFLLQKTVKGINLEYINAFFKAMYSFKTTEELDKYKNDIDNMVELLKIHVKKTQSQGELININNAVVKGSKKEGYYYEIDFEKPKKFEIQDQPPVQPKELVPIGQPSVQPQVQVKDQPQDQPQVQVKKSVSSGQPPAQLQEPVQPQEEVSSNEPSEPGIFSKIGSAIANFFKAIAEGFAWPFKAAYKAIFG